MKTSFFSHILTSLIILPHCPLICIHSPPFVPNTLSSHRIFILSFNTYRNFLSSLVLFSSFLPCPHLSFLVPPVLFSPLLSSHQVTRRPGNAKAWRSENAAQVRPSVRPVHPVHDFPLVSLHLLPLLLSLINWFPGITSLYTYLPRPFSSFLFRFRFRLLPGRYYKLINLTLHTCLSFPLINKESKSCSSSSPPSLPFFLSLFLPYYSFLSSSPLPSLCLFLPYYSFHFLFIPTFLSIFFALLFLTDSFFVHLISQADFLLSKSILSNPFNPIYFIEFAIELLGAVSFQSYLTSILFSLTSFSKFHCWTTCTANHHSSAIWVDHFKITVQEIIGACQLQQLNQRLRL